ncbi:MAG: TatD family hydrolase [Ignavibacteriae bacterium]|nr:TatD family hydrolase [Ignavibacteriota bacterium]
MIIDTHAHLFYDNMQLNFDEMLARAKDAGISAIIVPAVDLKTSQAGIQLAEKYDIIYTLVGIHPGDAVKSDLKDLEEIEKLCSHEKVVGIGETGLDYYWDTSNVDTQKEFFKLQIQLAREKELPIVIHTRESCGDAIAMIKENYDESLSGQFHCFGGTPDEAEEILSMDNSRDNFYISFCGNVTYKNFKETDTVKAVPIERMLSETDSPFLTPVPNRGKTNEPSNVIYTIEKLAEIKNIGKDKLIEQLYNNARKLFKKII